MRLETTAANLKAAMALTAGLVERRVTIPILATVKIGDRKISATNLDMAVEIALPTMGRVRGEIAIEAEALSALARYTRKDETIVISEKDALVTVSFNGSEYRMASLPGSDFPVFETIEGEVSQVGNAGIVDAMRRVSFAISNEETRYYLNGVCFFPKPDGTIMLCATDGHRLAMVDLPSAPANSERKIIPSGCVSYLIARKKEPKTAIFTDLRTRFDYDGLSVSAKLIDGTFPDVLRVLPAAPVPLVTFDRERMLSALMRIAAFAGRHHSRAVKIVCVPPGLVLTSKTGDREARETLAADVHGEAFEAGYNVHYLLDSLKQFRSESVTLSAEPDKIAASPAVFTAENDSLRVVLMPMRV